MKNAKKTDSTLTQSNRRSQGISLNLEQDTKTQSQPITIPKSYPSLETDSRTSTSKSNDPRSPRRKSHSPTNHRITIFLSSDSKSHTPSLDSPIKTSPKEKYIKHTKTYKEIVFEAIKLFQIEIEDLYYIVNILIQILKGTHKALLDNLAIRKKKPICNFHTPIQFTENQIAIISTALTEFTPNKKSKKYEHFIANKLQVLLPYITGKFRRSLMSGLLSQIAECDTNSVHFDTEDQFIDYYFCHSKTVIESLSFLCNIIVAPSPLVLNTHMISKYNHFEIGILYQDFERITTDKLYGLIHHSNFSKLTKFSHYISQTLFEEHKYMLCCTDNETMHLNRFLYLLNESISKRFTTNYREIKYAIAHLKKELLLSETILIKQILEDASLSFISMTSPIQAHLDLDICSPHITDNASYNLMAILKTDLSNKEKQLKWSKSDMASSSVTHQTDFIDIADTPKIHLKLKHPERYMISENKTCSFSSHGK
ncbi:MAG: hypothetical protein ACK5WS_07405 [Alphaproteobacteria bacterium]|jgi:hypothetical protein|nr:hypothetical protein [Candidatus Jidaibacter sp.]